MWNRKKKNQVIELAELFDRNINTRAAISLIIEKIDREVENVVLNFDKIKFVSRSFAHELLKLIENHDRLIKIERVNKDIRNLLAIVKRSKESHRDSVHPSFVKLSHSASSF